MDLRSDSRGSEDLRPSIVGTDERSLITFHRQAPARRVRALPAQRVHRLRGRPGPTVERTLCAPLGSGSECRTRRRSHKSTGYHGVSGVSSCPPPPDPRSCTKGGGVGRTSSCRVEVAQGGRGRHRAALTTAPEHGDGTLRHRDLVVGSARSSR
jgi:hypothetical protein